jgi:hypothetical protein
LRNPPKRFSKVLELFVKLNIRLETCVPFRHLDEEQTLY